MIARQPPLSKGSVFQKPTLAQQIWRLFQGFDGPLALAVGCLVGLGLLVMYSAGFDHGTRFVDHARNMLIAGVIMMVVAQIPPSKMMAWALPIYAVGVVLLVAVALFGITKKGSTRWINLGVVIQPSEILKIALPLMLAAWFKSERGSCGCPISLWRS